MREILLPHTGKVCMKEFGLATTKPALAHTLQKSTNWINTEIFYYHSLLGHTFAHPAYGEGKEPPLPTGMSTSAAHGSECLGFSLM